MLTAVSRPHDGPKWRIRLGLWIRSRRHPAIPRPAGDGLRPLTICCGSRRIGWPRRGRPRRGRPAPGRSASPSVPGIYGGRSAADRRRVAVGQAGDGGGRRAVAGQQDHDQAQADAAGPCSTPSKSQEQPAGQVALGVHGWEASFRQPRRSAVLWKAAATRKATSSLGAIVTTVMRRSSDHLPSASSDIDERRKWSAYNWDAAARPVAVGWLAAAGWEG